MSVLMQKVDSAQWSQRLNLVNIFKKFCQWCTSKFEFWCLVGALTLIEPILCAYWPVGVILLAQVACLAASTILYVIQLIGVASREWEKIIMMEAMSSLQSVVIPKHMMDLSLIKVFIFFSAEGEYILEFFCLTCGWILIFWHPGLAALRCFRPFRLLWFYEVEVFRSATELYFSPIFGEVFVSRGFRVLKFAIKALSALGNEMFRLTADTKGGLLLMMIFFYSAFVLGTSIWIETNASLGGCNTPGASCLYVNETLVSSNGTIPGCNSAPSCMYTMVRLTTFDTNGFDYVYMLVENHKFLFFLTMVYMCITAFGIINGLVGIFGTAFQRASDIAFEDEEDRLAENEAKAAEKLVKSSRNLYADDDDDDDDDGAKEGAVGDEKPKEGRDSVAGTTGGESKTVLEGMSSTSEGPVQPRPESLRLTVKFVQSLQNKHGGRRGFAGASYQSLPSAASYQTLTPSAVNLRANLNASSFDIRGGNDPLASPPRRPSDVGGGGVGSAAGSPVKVSSEYGSKIASFTSPRTSDLVGAGILPPAKVTQLVNEVNRLEHTLEHQNRLMESMMEHILHLQRQIKEAYGEQKSSEHSMRLESFVSLPNVRASEDENSAEVSADLGSIAEEGG